MQGFDLLMIIGIAIGLSMDAFAVSVANGCIIQELRFHHALRFAFFFGLFQAVMPLIGWLTGMSLRTYIISFDHWIAFLLLAGIGGKMMYESLPNRSSAESEASKNSCLHWPTLFMLSLATSIDALAVGVSFAAIGIDIFFPILLIGSITFVNCMIGIFLGNRFGHIFEDKIELIGGVILLGIGLKILIEHLLKGV